MPSPFPGMDPYLEDPGGWQNFHNTYVAHLKDDLNDALPPGYVAVATERVIVEFPQAENRGIGPDVSILRSGRGHRRVARAEHDAPVQVAVEPYELVEASLEIRDRKGQRLVTAIELMSPTNKSSSGDGREMYLRKQKEVLSSPVHLVEIDILRHGVWTVAIPEAVARRGRQFDYIVSVNRAGERGHFEFYPIRLQDPLHRIAIPLAGEDPDAVADLQALVARAYDTGRHRDLVDYAVDPVPPLSPEHAAWAREIVVRALPRG